MKTRRKNPFIVFSALLVYLTACNHNQDQNLTKDQVQWVEKTLSNMSIEEKVGQVLAPAISGRKSTSNPDPAAKVKDWIQKYHIGHVYIASNRMDPVNTAEFINEIQVESTTPLLIHSDLECGPGDRFDGGTIFPPLMGIAQTGSETIAHTMAAITAKEARAMGIHLINSPVLDVNINPDNPVICIRSFGDNPELITSLGAAFVKGLNENGLIGAAKHFPGHGDVSVDSHSKMPSINASRERLDSIEFFPYKKIIDAGLMAIMTAHISIPSLDPTPGLPATMSKLILTGVLREELGFNGLIITDAFDMGGILESGTFEESVVESFLAGNDVVLLWTVPRFETVFPYVIKAIKAGRISQSRLDESVRRILIMKAKLGLHEQKLVDLEKIPQTVGTPEHREIANEIYEKSVVLVKNDKQTIPLPEKGIKIAVLSINDDDHHLEIAKTFIDEIKRRSNVVSAVSIDPQTQGNELDQSLITAQDADVIVVGLFARIFARRGSSSLVNEQLIRFLNELSAADTPVFVVSFGSPYLISQFPDVDGYMISTEPTWDFYGYDKYRPGQIAAVRALFGEIDISGRLAVTIPDLFSFGHGLTYYFNKISSL
jgi:beta-N-acetylhexosaminidase